ncbi:hypothetical protein [Butyrivibrio sp. WCD3002]|uniref:hypothetical protein n=1 Tax=Butyrivibrio sp. WCD3002 TaxID=1280676 RepID=UPI0004275AFC|nr:hypothetical protein [Butyrivibrio sp. WCD3002]
MNRSELFASILMEKNDEKLHKFIDEMSERDAKYMLFSLTRTVQKHAPAGMIEPLSF